MRIFITGAAGFIGQATTKELIAHGHSVVGLARSDANADLLRTLGASRAAVARALAVEYGCLGAAAGLGGSALGGVLAWIVLRFVLDVPWSFEPVPLLLGFTAPIALALAVGFFGTFRLLGQPPLPLLRRE